jgi:hypothetical protein
MESANGQAQGQDMSSTGLTSSAQPAQSQPASVQTSDERVFRQSEVNDIVKKAKYGAVEDYKRVATEQPDYASRKYGESGLSPQHHTQPQSMAPDEGHYRKIAAQEAQRLRDEWVQEARTKAEADSARGIVQTFWNKISPGREKYQDFEKVTSDIEYSQFPHVVQLLAQADNAHDILYSFGNDRIKMAQLEYLASKSPRDAFVQMQRLSQSIKDNEAASKIKTPNEPLSKLRPSNLGTDSGVMTVSDYRKRYKV